MAKVKDTPNLPGSSRMQMPSTGDKLGSKITISNGKASAAVKAGGAASLVSKAKGKTGMKSSNPYGSIC